MFDEGGGKLPRCEERVSEASFPASTEMEAAWARKSALLLSSREHQIQVKPGLDLLRRS